MNNEKILISMIAPIECRAGYGERARDIARAILSSDKYDLKIWSINWGNTPFTGLDPNDPADQKIRNCILKTPDLPKQPDIHIHISVPNEFHPLGRFNIGITAGIETDHVDSSWLEGANKMDLILVSSEHAKSGFVNTAYERKDQQGNIVPNQTLRLQKPIQVLFEGADTSVFKKLDKKSEDAISNYLDTEIKEEHSFLFCGHWLQGDLGQDRKDVGMLIKTFFETFKNKKKRPGLILKTSGANNSIIDRKIILDKIESIRKTCGDNKDLPNVYLLHGDLTRNEMNSLYNHPKVLAHISFTKGEGFGRPLLECTFSTKPVLVPKHSGYVDFLDHAIWLPYKITPIHPSAQWQGVLNAGTQWATIDYVAAGEFMKDVFENFKIYSDLGKRQAFVSKTKFTLDIMKDNLLQILNGISEKFPTQQKIVLPKLKKLEPKKEVMENGK